MNYRATLGLLIVFLLLAGAVYYVQGTPPATPTPAAGAASIPVWSFAAADVTGLTVKSGGKTVALAHGADATWALTQPESAPADQRSVDGLAGRLAALQATRTIENPPSLAEYGLEKPRAEATVTLKSGETKALAIGDQTPDQSGGYAKLPGSNTVYILAGGIGDELANLPATPPKALPTPVVPTPAPAAAPSATP